MFYGPRPYGLEYSRYALEAATKFCRVATFISVHEKGRLNHGDWGDTEEIRVYRSQYDVAECRPPMSLSHGSASLVG